MKFRRLLLRGTVKSAAEWTLMSMACNLLKLFHKARTGRLGIYFVVPVSFSESVSQNPAIIEYYFMETTREAAAPLVVVRFF